MAAVALMKFVQGVFTGPDGQAIFVDPGVAVDVLNVDNSDIASWQIDILDVAPASAVSRGDAVAFDNAGDTPTASIVPDTPGSYRIRVQLWEQVNRNGPPDNVDIRCFIIKTAAGKVIPPYQGDPPPLPSLASSKPGAKPNEMNVGGQELGWHGTGNDGLLADVLKTAGGSPSRVLWVSRSAAISGANGTVTNPFATIQAALNVLPTAGGTVDLQQDWQIIIAPGRYVENITIPAKIPLKILGLGTVSISSITWVLNSSPAGIPVPLEVQGIDSSGPFGIDATQGEHATAYGSNLKTIDCSYSDLKDNNTVYKYGIVTLIRQRGNTTVKLPSMSDDTDSLFYGIDCAYLDLSQDPGAPPACDLINCQANILLDGSHTVVARACTYLAPSLPDPTIGGANLNADTFSVNATLGSPAFTGGSAITGTNHNFLVGNSLQNEYTDSCMFQSSGASTITGFMAPVGSRYPRTRHYVHVGGGTITISHQNAGSDPANRVITSTAASLSWTQGHVLRLTRDYTNSRWLASLV